jgi:hypothetical protein
VFLFAALVSRWVTVVVGLNFLAFDLYWPFYVADAEPITPNQLLAARNAVFLTFAFYSFMFLPNSFEKVYPVHFPKGYLVMIAIAGSLILIQTGHDSFDDFGSLLMLSVCALVIQRNLV